MSEPRRIRLSRKKGFDLQALSILEVNGLPAVNVARPSGWGNPCNVGLCLACGVEHTAAEAVAEFRALLSQDVAEEPVVLDPLRGKNLACWCHIWVCPKCGGYIDEDTPDRQPIRCPYCNPINEAPYMSRVPCHADVLLELANKP